MYLEHFHLSCPPFGLTPDTHFFCQSSQHIGALNTARVCLDQGEGFIKITGEVGSGKTLLCRLLLNQLNSAKFITAYLPNPNVSAQDLPLIIAKEIGLDLSTTGRISHEIQEAILKHLIELNQQGKTVVLLIDEAQAMPVETLESLRLLTNLETETHKLLQVVLLGQPELNDKINLPELRQLKQRIAFSYQIRPLTKTEMNGYIRHRLAIAGHTQGNLFTDKALQQLCKYSRGIPRVINILCHKALLAAYGLGLPAATAKCVKQARRDTEFAACYSSRKRWHQKIKHHLFNLLRLKSED
jgi:MSHA biogenesis protein MshM